MNTFIRVILGTICVSGLALAQFRPTMPPRPPISVPMRPPVQSGSMIWVVE